MMKKVLISGSIALLFTTSSVFAGGYGEVKEGVEKASDVLAEVQQAQETVEEAGKMGNHAKEMANEVTDIVKNKSSEMATGAITGNANVVENTKQMAEGVTDVVKDKSKKAATDAVDGVMNKASEKMNETVDDAVNDAVKGIVE